MAVNDNVQQGQKFRVFEFLPQQALQNPVVDTWVKMVNVHLETVLGSRFVLQIGVHQLLGFLDPTVWKGSTSEPGENFVEDRFNLKHDCPLNDPVWEIGQFPKFTLFSLVIDR